MVVGVWDNHPTIVQMRYVCYLRCYRRSGGRCTFQAWHSTRAQTCGEEECCQQWWRAWPCQIGESWGLTCIREWLQKILDAMLLTASIFRISAYLYRTSWPVPDGSWCRQRSSWSSLLVPSLQVKISLLLILKVGWIDAPAVVVEVLSCSSKSSCGILEILPQPCIVAWMPEYAQILAQLLIMWTSRDICLSQSLSWYNSLMVLKAWSCFHVFARLVSICKYI